MNLKVELVNLAPCKKQLRFVLPAEDVDAAFADTTKQFQKQANLPGFRKGKAPRRIVEQMYGREYLANEALDFMLPEVTTKALEQEILPWRDESTLQE